MRLRTFTAATTREAMAQVREILGEDAVILSTHDSARGQGVRITAGVDTVQVEVVHGRKQFPVSQVSAPAEDHERAGLRQKSPR